MKTNLDRLNRTVGAAVIDSNAKLLSLIDRDTGGLQLLEGKSTAQTNLAVVADRRTLHSGTKQTNRSWSNSLQLGDTIAGTANFATRLIEPGLDAALPVLSKIKVL